MCRVKTLIEIFGFGSHAGIVAMILAMMLAMILDQVLLFNAAI